MNPSFKFFLAFIISLAVSCKTSLTTNFLVITFCILYLIYKRVKFKSLIWMLALPFLAAFTIFATLFWFTNTPSLHYALSLSSRVYVYTLTIGCVSVSTNATTFARSLEQNLHLPSKFAYGVLAALNIVPYMKAAVKQIHTAGMMRGVYLSFWSPVLYLKAILVALNSADNLAQGMAAHAYVENQPRSIIVKVPIKKSDWLISITLLAVTLFCLFLFK